ncbi:unnamed protein product, partial [Scytosiphon promiscuus]
STRLVAEGSHQVWDYDGGAPKPDWRSPHRRSTTSGQVSP